MEFAIQGDAVNIAARLETFDKHKFTPDYFRQPCRILIGGKTVEYLAGQFLLEAMGKVELKGKKEKVDVYRVVGKVN
jgi:adenylate cyclase